MFLSPICRRAFLVCSLLFTRLEAQALPDEFHLWGEGKIGDKNIEMYLQRENGTWGGWYRYEGHAGKLSLSFHAEQDNAWLLKESFQGQITGYILVSKASYTGDQIFGTWENADRSRDFKFSLPIHQLKGRSMESPLPDSDPTLKMFTYYQMISTRDSLPEGEVQESGNYYESVWFKGGEVAAVANGLNKEWNRPGYEPDWENLKVNAGWLSGGDGCEEYNTQHADFIEEKVAVLSTSFEGYCRGAAHPNHGSAFRCVDLRNGGHLSLGDLFTEQALMSLQKNGYTGCEPGELSEEELQEISAQAFEADRRNFSLSHKLLSTYIPFYDFHSGLPCLFFDLELEPQMLNEYYRFLAR